MYPSGRWNQGLPGRTGGWVTWQPQEKMPEHAILGPATRAVSPHGGDFACECDLARGAFIDVDDLARPILILHGTDTLCGLFALPAVNVRVSVHPKILIKIHKLLVAFRVRTRHRFASVMEPAAVFV